MIEVFSGPNVQASGSVRGVVDVTVNGRVVRQSVRAPNLDAWNARLAEIQAEVESAVTLDDAEKDLAAGNIMDAYTQDVREKVSLSLLRKAFQEEDPRTAFQLFSRLDSFRQTRGKSMLDVVALLGPHGLTQAEWDRMVARWDYLGSQSNVSLMDSYQAFLAGDNF